MGNSFSTISPERFRDHVFSLVLYHIAPQANPNLIFTSSDKCTRDNLPSPEDGDYNKILDLYKLHDEKVQQYLLTHVLNSEENMTRFYQTLLSHLKDHDNEELPTKKYQIDDRKYEKLTKEQLKKIDQASANNRIVPPPPSPYQSNKKKYNNNKDELTSHFTRCHIVNEQQQLSQHRQDDREIDRIDEGTARYSRRFGDKRMIQENFD